MWAVSGRLSISKQKKIGHRVPAAVEFINIHSLNHNLWRVYNHSVSANSRRPNESLKLTEITVDENAARCAADLKNHLSTSAQRTTNFRLHVAAA
jgi:hypothetical protein